MIFRGHVRSQGSTLRLPHLWKTKSCTNHILHWVMKPGIVIQQTSLTLLKKENNNLTKKKHLKHNENNTPAKKKRSKLFAVAACSQGAKTCLLASSFCLARISFCFFLDCGISMLGSGVPGSRPTWKLRHGSCFENDITLVKLWVRWPKIRMQLITTKFEINFF